MKNIYLFLAFLFMLTAYSCHKTNITPTPEQKVDVYVAGYELSDEQSRSIAKYWNNGVAINLTDGTQNAIAKSIVVSGNDVYVAGTEGSSAKYWKNGVPVTLDDAPVSGNDSTKSYTATAIAVSGNDVYVTGYMSWSQKRPVPPGQRGNGVIGGQIPRYWKNGISTKLPLNEFTGQVNSIVVSGNDVYMAGYSTNGLVSHAVYWKNGILATLADPGDETSTGAVAIAVSGSDIYIGGYHESADFNYEIANYWKNGVPVTVGVDMEYTEADAIAISGSDVYLAGIAWDQGVNTYATWWKNGVESRIQKGWSYAYAMAVAGNDVYIAGVRSDETTSNFAASYWKNGVEVQLGDGKKLNETAYSICLAPQ